MTSNNVKSTEKNQHNVDGTILAEYTIHKRIGKGAYGIVYKAYDKSNKQNVAIKKIFDAFRNKTDAQRTYREILFLKSFQRHPNIITMLDIYKAVNHRDLYVVFEYMENDLNKVIRDKILKDVHIRFIMFQLCNGLSYIHGCKVMHRDLKPSNILIDKSCSIKIGDLGLARSLSDSQDCLTEYIATRWYRAPEILVANRKYSHHVDIWSLGCILAEMLQSKPLFPGASTNHQLQMIVNLVRSSPPHADKFYSGFKNKSEEAIDLLHQILVLNPDQRPNTEEILQHTYISKYFPSETHTIPQVFPHTVVLDINDNNQLEIDEYQDRLYDIVKRSKKKKVMKRLNKSSQDDIIHNGQMQPQDSSYSKLRSSEKENKHSFNKHSFQGKVKANSGNIKSEDHKYLNPTTHDYDVASTSDYETRDVSKKNYIAYNKQNVANYTHHRRKDTKLQSHPAVAHISNGEAPVLVTSKTYHIDKNHVKNVSKTWLDPTAYEMKKTNVKDRKSLNINSVNNVSGKYNNTGDTPYLTRLSHKVACKKNEMKPIPALTCEEIESELIRKHSMSNSHQNMKVSQSVQDVTQNTFDKKWDNLLKPFSQSQLQYINGRPIKCYLQDDEVSMSDGKPFQSEKSIGFKKSSNAPFVAQVNIPNGSSTTYWVESKENKCTIDTSSGTTYIPLGKVKHVYYGDADIRSNILNYGRTGISKDRKVEKKLHRNNILVNKTASQHQFMKEEHEGIGIVKTYPLSNEPKHFEFSHHRDPLFSDKNDIEEKIDNPVYSVSHVPSVQNVSDTLQSIHDRNERRHSDHALKYMCNGDNHTDLEQAPYSYHTHYTGELSAKSSGHMCKNYYNSNTNHTDNSTPNFTSTQSMQTQKQPGNNAINGNNIVVSCERNVKDEYGGHDESGRGNNIFQCFKKNKSKVKTYFHYNKQFNEKLNNMHKLSVLNFNVAPIGMDDSDMNDNEININQEANDNPVRLLKPDLNEYGTDISVSHGTFCSFCDW